MRLRLLAVVTATLAIVARAGAVPSLAAPPAGFVQMAVPSNAFVLVSIPFEPFDPDINALFGGQLTGSTDTNTADAMLYWLPSQQSYTNAWRAEGLGDPALDGRWIDRFDAIPSPSTLTFAAGDAFWLRSRQPCDQRVFLRGRVALSASTLRPFLPGYNLSGYPYTASIPINETALTASGAWGWDVADGDTLMRWNEFDQEYSPSYYLFCSDLLYPAGWRQADGVPTSDRFRLGEGFFYCRASVAPPFVWSEPRPYANPFGATNALPRIEGIAINPAIPSATLTILSQADQAWIVDILTLDADTDGAFSATGWTPAARIHSLGQPAFVWSDLPGNGRTAVTETYARFYLVARADLDADDDGLSDALEIHAYGTHPAVADTDGDGVSDGVEIALGRDPLVAQTVVHLPFLERFESDTVHPGELEGQNGWTASPPGAALVQHNDVFEGTGALRIHRPNGIPDVVPTVVSHDFSEAAAPETVWLDLRLKVNSAPIPDTVPEAAIGLLFDVCGRLVVCDGSRPAGQQWITLTNHVPYAEGTWARISARVNYASQTWLVCLDGSPVAEHLGFAFPQARLSELRFEGNAAVMDDVFLGEAQPPLLSLDGDSLPDEWELEHFGHLGFGDGDDPDNDGLSNLREYELGTDPASADTDGDGVHDGTEMLLGTDPHDPADGSLDSDGDGLSNAAEAALGTDPLNADSDGDGLSDHAEVHVYGTNPLLRDSDHDGMPDNVEMMWGYDPVASNAYFRIDVASSGTWATGFEPSEGYVPGPLRGQGGWTASNAVAVVDNVAHTGTQSVLLPGDLSANDPSQRILGNIGAEGCDAAWVTVHLRGAVGEPAVDIDQISAASAYIDRDGVVAFDGTSMSWVRSKRHFTFSTNDWVRLDLRLDFASKTYLVCANGVLAHSGLRFADTNITSLSALEIVGAPGSAPSADTLLDDVRFSTTEPDGLDFDGDGLTNAEEAQLGTDPLSTDSDGDGLSDFDEVRVLGTNPVAIDTDGDGIPDGTELAVGLDPVNPDSDGDGWPDGFEISVGFDPLDPLVHPFILSGRITDSSDRPGAVFMLAYSDSGTVTNVFEAAGSTLDYGVSNLLCGVSYDIVAFRDTNGDGVFQPWEPVAAFVGNPLPPLSSHLDGVDLVLSEDTTLDSDSDGITDHDEAYLYESNPYVYTTTSENVSTLTRQVWYDVGGNTVSQLTNHTLFPYWPDHEHEVTGLFEASVNVADDYGQRIFGRFLAPRTGHYTFWIASDDNGELWITMAGDRQRIARVPGSTSSRQWNKYPEQQSAPVLLQAGGVYLIEALMKEQGNADNLAVGIRFPDERIERPMPARWFLTPDPGIDLSADFDGDGLTDYEEWVHGSDPRNTDTSGDGMTDYEKVVLGIDPQLQGNGSTEPPASPPPSEVAALAGSSAMPLSGTWLQDANATRAVSRRGRVAYELMAPAPDVYRIRVAFSQSGAPEGVRQQCPMDVSINGQHLVRRLFSLHNGEAASIEMDTPFLDQGTFRLELLWDNPRSGLSLRIEEVRLLRWNAQDSNEDGIQDWVANRLFLANSITPAPEDSFTSPVCLEGTASHAGFMVIDGAPPIMPGPNNRWFGNVGLPADGGLTNVIVRFENGGHVLARSLRWKAFNMLLDELSNSQIRRGDAMRFAASVPDAVDGTATIRINDEVIGEVTPGHAVVYRFENAGTYVIEADFQGEDVHGNPVSQSRQIGLTAVSITSEVIAAQVNQVRPWQPPPEWPATAVIEWDDRVQRPVADGTAGLLVNTPEERYAVVRTGEQGPILGAITIKAFNLWVMRNTDLVYETIYEDGSFRAASTMIMSPVVPEVRIEQRCRGAVAYLDGARMRTFLPEDFDPLGEVFIVFAHSSPLAHSICHYTDSFQGALLIGRGY